MEKCFFWRLWPQQRERYTCKDRLGTVTPLSGIDNRIIVAIISSSIGPVLHVTLFHLRLPRTESTLGTSKPKHRQQQKIQNCFDLSREMTTHWFKPEFIQTQTLFRLLFVVHIILPLLFPSSWLCFLICCRSVSLSRPPSTVCVCVCVCVCVILVAMSLVGTLYSSARTFYFMA